MRGLPETLSRTPMRPLCDSLVYSIQSTKSGEIKRKYDHNSEVISALSKHSLTLISINLGTTFLKTKIPFILIDYKPKIFTFI